jgi:hypothetical protein
MHMAEMPMPKSFKTALISYAKSSGLRTDHRAHLQRRADDDRSEEVWQTIEHAAQKNKIPIFAKFFIGEVLAARRAAMSIGHRGKYRERYRKQAEQMERTAKFLREPPPDGISPYPRCTELARMLNDAARCFRQEVDVSRDSPGVVKLSRESKPPTIFMSMVSNDLYNITGCWLDKEVAVLAEIAFDSQDVIDPEDARWARRQVGARTAVRKARR